MINSLAVSLTSNLTSSFSNSLLQHEPLFRFGVFISVMLLMMAWEALAPARIDPVGRTRRWRTNLLILLSGTLLLRLLVPISLVALSDWAQQHNIGGLNLLGLPFWLNVLLALVLLDLIIYWQHRLFHQIPWLWRLHQIHHADPHIDSTSGLRFHPLEILLSYGVKLVAVLLLGTPALAIMLFEVILNASAIFNHSNIRLPAKIEWPLRQLIVTQQMHRIHHSQRPEETNSNYGFNLSVWDKLFVSYRKTATKTDQELDIGLVQYPEPEQNSGLGYLLSLPFRRQK